MKKFLVVFTGKKYGDKFHYRGIIFLDGSSVCEFGQILSEYKEFENWCNEKCKQLSGGAEFKVVDQIISTQEIKDPYCFVN